MIISSSMNNLKTNGLLVTLIFSLIIFVIGCENSQSSGTSQDKNLNKGDELSKLEKNDQPQKLSEEEQRQKLKEFLEKLKQSQANKVRFSASHILIAYEGAERSEAKRTKEEAKQLAEKLLKETQSGNDLAKLAKQYSDCPSKENGGSLGSFWSGEMIPEFEDALNKTKIGEIYPQLVETKFGFHIMKRQPIEDIHIGHILLSYQGAMKADPSQQRTKEEAQKLAKELREKIAKNPETKEDLASKNSDCPSKERGGDLGEVGKGRLHPNFEKAAFDLREGEISPVVETPFGYHIIWRYRAEKNENPQPETGGGAPKNENPQPQKVQ